MFMMYTISKMLVGQSDFVRNCMINLAFEKKRKAKYKGENLINHAVKRTKSVLRFWYNVF